MRMAGWSAGSALSSTISPSLVWLHWIGEHDHALGVGGQSLGRVVEILIRVDTQAPQPDVGIVAAREEADLCIVAVVVSEVVENQAHAS